MENEGLSVSYTAALMYGFCFAIFCTGMCKNILLYSLKGMSHEIRSGHAYG
jgi:hypothetical protein